MLLMNLANFNQFEREMIPERTRETLQHMKAQGVILGRAPYGYEYVKKQVDDKGRRLLVPLASEQEVIGKIGALRAEGLSLREVGIRLALEGHVPELGGAWYPKRVSGLLTEANPAP